MTFAGAAMQCTVERVASLIFWRWFVPKSTPTLNDRIVNCGSSRWRYAQERDEWATWFLAARTNLQIPKATGARRLLVLRAFSGRERLRDYVNLVGGCKAVIDALVLQDLLVDDSPKWLEDDYRQERRERSGTWFELSEFA